MADILKKHSGPVLLSAAFAIIGAVFGFWSDADENGVYLTANYPGGQTVFTVGRNGSSISDIGSLDGPALQQLVAVISALPSGHALSRELWNLAQRGKGPFAPEQVNIRLIFTEKYSGPIGSACRQSSLFGKSIVAFDVSESVELGIGSKGLLGIQALVPEEFSTLCNNTTEDTLSMWINRGLVESWVGHSLADRKSLTVKAKLVLTNTIPNINAQVATL